MCAGGAAPAVQSSEAANEVPERCMPSTSKACRRCGLRLLVLRDVVDRLIGSDPMGSD